MDTKRFISRPFVVTAAVAALALLPGAYAASPAPVKDQAATQRALDLEHEMMQSDGVNHPRETVKQRAAEDAASKPSAKAKTQRELDLEHEMNQTDGANHPREKATGKLATPKADKVAGKTQADLDHEHERMLSDGTYHPREVLKK